MKLQIVKKKDDPITLRISIGGSHNEAYIVYRGDLAKVKMLLDNQTRLGGGLRITSNIYPAVNGEYVIYKLGFQISSRDTPFYYIAEAARRR